MEIVTDIETIKKKPYNKPLLIEVGQAVSLTLGVGRRSRDGAFGGFFG